MIIFYSVLFLGFVLLIAVLDRKFLHLHQLNKYSVDQRVGLGTLLFVRSVALSVILVIFFASLIISIKYPLILKISSSIAFGEIYLAVVICFHFGYLFISILKNGLNGYREIFQFWNETLERLWLIGIKKDFREQYSRHGAWRWSVLARRLRIWLSARKAPSVHFVRVIAILLAGSIAVILAMILIDGLQPTQGGHGLLTLEQLVKAPQVLTSVLVVLGIPIAFVIWFFRDQNNLWQLENSRKDINLKDFQKLAEWAAGLHLPEDKIIRVVKISSTSKANSTGEISESGSIEESADSVESAGQPKSSVMKTYSRRDGAIALQVSAIYQLQAFLRGDFGIHFQRPAFQLLKSVWMALTQRHIEDISKVGGGSRKEYRESVEQWCKQILELTSEGVGSALTLALSEGNGKILRAHARDLPHITLAGWQGMLPGRSSVANSVMLDGLDLQSAQLQGISLRQSFLSKTDLSSAKLFGANLEFSHLQCSDLRWVDARFSTFNGARMQGAILDGAIFIGADLFVVDLRGASLDGARLQSAYLNGAKLEGARLLNIGYDDDTDFTNVSVDASTVVAVAILKSGLYNSSERKYPDDFIVDEAKTTLLQSALAQKGLILP